MPKPLRYPEGSSGEGGPGRAAPGKAAPGGSGFKAIILRHEGGHVPSFGKFHIAMLLAMITAGIAAAATTPQASCKDVPLRVSVHYAFDWPLVAQQQLARSLKVDCALQTAGDAVTRLTALIKDALRQNGVEGLVITPLMSAEGEDSLGLDLVMTTALDDVTPGAIPGTILRATVLPVTVTGRPIEDFIDYARLERTAEEGGELVLRFALDVQAAALVNARPMVEWRRDGVIMKDQGSARYAVTADDAGAVITADLVMRGPHGDVLARKRYAAPEASSAQP